MGKATFWSWAGYVPLFINSLLVVHALLLRVTVSIWPVFAEGWKHQYFSNFSWLPVAMLVVSFAMLFLKIRLWLKAATIAVNLLYYGILYLFLHAFQYA